jgi:septal ring-binding cell division protein DamX
MAKRNVNPKKETGKRYQIEMGSWSLLLWGCCALFFMAWIFVLGVLVGRGFLPGADSAFSDLKTQVAKLQEMTGRSKRGEQTLQTKEPIDETLAFYEKLESKEDEAKKREPDRPAPKEGTAQQTLNQTAGDPPKKNQQGREEVPKLDRGVPPVASSTGKGNYTLQLASLEEKTKAEAMVRDLLSKGHDAYFSEARVKGKTFYRVRCGRFVNRDEAEEYGVKLLKSLHIRGFVSKLE